MSYQRDYSKRLDIGIIGCGSHSCRNLLPVMNYLPVRIRAVCDISREQAEKTAAQYGCAAYASSGEMYGKEKLDAVFICVGPKQHPALVLEALDKGLHVWVEKPVSVRAAQVEEMIAKCGDRVVVAGLKKAFMPAAFKAKEIIDSPEYGNLRSLLAVYPMNLEENGEELLEAGDTPNWLRNGVHPLALLLFLGGRVKAVTTVLGPLGTGAVLLEFENGVMGNLHLSDGSKPNREYYGIYGADWEAAIEGASVSLQRGIPFVYDSTANYAPEGFDSGKIVWDTSNCLATLENKALFTQGFYNETKYFCDCVLENKRPEYGTLEFALEIMRVYEAAYRSHGSKVLL